MARKTAYKASCLLVEVNARLFILRAIKSVKVGSNTSVIVILNCKLKSTCNIFSKKQATKIKKLPYKE